LTKASRAEILFSTTIAKEKLKKHKNYKLNEELRTNFTYIEIKRKGSYEKLKPLRLSPDDILLESSAARVQVFIEINNKEYVEFKKVEDIDASIKLAILQKTKNDIYASKRACMALVKKVQDLKEEKALIIKAATTVVLSMVELIAGFVDVAGININCTLREFRKITKELVSSYDSFIDGRLLQEQLDYQKKLIAEFKSAVEEKVADVSGYAESEGDSSDASPEGESDSDTSESSQGGDGYSFNNANLPQCLHCCLEPPSGELFICGICNTTTHLACEERFTHELELLQSEQLCLFCRLKMSDADVDTRCGIEKLTGNAKRKAMQSLKLKNQQRGSALSLPFQDDAQLFIITKLRQVIMLRNYKADPILEWSLPCKKQKGAIEATGSFVIAVRHAPKPHQLFKNAPISHITCIAIKGEKGKILVTDDHLRNFVLTAPSSDYSSKSREATSWGLSAQGGLVFDWKSNMKSENLIPEGGSHYVAPRRNGSDAQAHLAWIQDCAKVCSTFQDNLFDACPELRIRFQATIPHQLSSGLFSTFRQSGCQWVGPHTDAVKKGIICFRFLHINL